MTTTTMDYKKKLMEYKKSIGATTYSAVTKTMAFKSSILNSDELEKQLYSSQKNLQPEQCHPLRSLTGIDEDELVYEKRQNAARESNVLRVSSLSPSPQPQQLKISVPEFLTEGSFLFEPIGRYMNWNSHHAFLASQAWCYIGDLKAFCDKYELKAINVSDVQTHANIISEVQFLLSGKAPFDMRRRFPGNIQNTENLLICISRCPSVEYHLERILTAFRRSLHKLSPDKQKTVKQNVHLAIRELHLDISARITEIQLYDQNVFEKQFHLKWKNSFD